MKDLKAALGNGTKPDITHVRTPLMVYCARACEYGDAKYERSNYLRPVVGTVADFQRYRAYLRAAVSHIMATLDAMERHQAMDPQLQYQPGLRESAYAADTDATPGAKVGASGLPHVAHAAASLNMALAQAVYYGLLPADPGQPWVIEELDSDDCPNCEGAGTVSADDGDDFNTLVDCGVCNP